MKNLEQENCIFCIKTDKTGQVIEEYSCKDSLGGIAVSMTMYRSNGLKLVWEFIRAGTVAECIEFQKLNGHELIVR